MSNANMPSGIPNAITRSLICIDAVEHADYFGLAYNPYLEQPVAFQGMMALIQRFEEFFNEISFPQQYFENRSFLHAKGDLLQRSGKVPQRFHGDDIFTAHTGKLVTFELDVRCRKNASWQGELLWKEAGLTHPFLSTLGFLKLVDQAVLKQEFHLCD